jgi:cyclopropane-fatty-acyl-phospholipid synthase
LSIETAPALAVADRPRQHVPRSSSRITEALLRAVVLRILGALPVGELKVTWPSEAETTVCGRQSGPRAEIIILRLRAVQRALANGAIGFAEGYMAGDWHSPDLDALLYWAALNNDRLAQRLRGNVGTRWANRLIHSRRRNTRQGSRRNIAFHYDIGNAFYRKWLDETLTYSSALFETSEMSLADAQQAKYRRLAEWLELEPGARVLEIGCGWGGFALYLAQEWGCHVTGVTISREQYDHAGARVAAAGLSDRIDLRLQDYRDLEGRFDRIVSIEMFEAVGEANWPVYFGKLRDLLRPGGLAVLQIICIAAARFEAYRRDPDFIQRYVFPGGMLPTAEAIGATAAGRGLELVREAFFGQSYARTLACWNETFQQRWPEIAEMGFDSRFKRMWEYYLSYCAAGFRGGLIDVGHFKIVKAAT